MARRLRSFGIIKVSLKSRKCDKNIFKATFHKEILFRSFYKKCSLKNINLAINVLFLKICCNVAIEWNLFLTVLKKKCCKFFEICTFWFNIFSISDQRNPTTQLTNLGMFGPVTNLLGSEPRSKIRRLESSPRASPQQEHSPRASSRHREASPEGITSVLGNYW